MTNKVWFRKNVNNIWYYQPANLTKTSTKVHWESLETLPKVLNFSKKNKNAFIQDPKTNCNLVSVDKKVKRKDLVELPPNIYEVAYYQFNYWLKPLIGKNDEEVLELINLIKIQEEFSKFVEAKPIYDKFKKLYRRGGLLYGPPGTGKSTALHQLIKKVKTKDTICIWLTTPLPTDLNDILQKEERLKIIIMEEITGLIAVDSEKMLNFLDGEKSLNNCFLLATTNYPERLASNILKRPGRFDFLMKLGYLTLVEIKLVFEKYLNISDIDFDLFKNKEFTIADIKELIFRMERDSLTLKEVIKLKDDQYKLADRDFNEKSGIGFKNNFED